MRSSVCMCCMKEKKIVRKKKTLNKNFDCINWSPQFKVSDVMIAINQIKIFQYADNLFLQIGDPFVCSRITSAFHIEKKDIDQIQPLTTNDSNLNQQHWQHKYISISHFKEHSLPTNHHTPRPTTDPLLTHTHQVTLANLVKLSY